MADNDNNTPQEHHTKNPYHKVLMKHGFKHESSGKYQFSTYKQNIDRHVYRHPDTHVKVEVGINHSKHDDSHPPKMWDYASSPDWAREHNGRIEKRGRKASDLDAHLESKKSTHVEQTHLLDCILQEAKVFEIVSSKTGQEQPNSENRIRFNSGYHDGASHHKQGGAWKDRNRMGTKMNHSHYDQVYVHGFHKGYDDSSAGNYDHSPSGTTTSDAAWKESGLKNGTSLKPHKLMGRDQKGKKIAPWMRESEILPEAYGEPTGFSKPAKNWYHVLVHHPNVIGWNQNGKAHHEFKQIHSGGSFTEAKKKAVEAHKESGHHVEVYNTVSHEVMYPKKQERNYGHPDHVLDHVDSPDNVIYKNHMKEDKESIDEKSLQHQPSPRWGGQGGFWKRLKKKVDRHFDEAEIPGNDSATPCDDCGKTHAASIPCAGKEVLDELGDDDVAMLSPASESDGMCNRAVKINRRATNRLTGLPDANKAILGKMAESKSHKKRYDFGNDVRAIARERVGQPPAKKVMVSKKFKRLKHKEDFTEAAKKSKGADDFFKSPGPVHIPQAMHDNLTGAGWKHIHGMSKHDASHDHYEHPKHDTIMVDKNGNHKTTRKTPLGHSWLSDMD